MVPHVVKITTHAGSSMEVPVYCDVNFRSKKELKEAVAGGRKLGIFSPGPFPVDCSSGRHCVEGPHYPQPHRWYATVEVRDGVIVSVK